MNTSDTIIPLPRSLRDASRVSLDPKLKRQAERLWPDSLPHAAHNRAAWLRSVQQLRNSRGWVLDKGTPAPGWCAPSFLN